MAAQKIVLLFCGDYVEDYEVMVSFQGFKRMELQWMPFCPDCRTAVHQGTGHQVMVLFQALQAYGIVVDAVCSECCTVVHQGTTGHQVNRGNVNTRSRDVL